jgi:hypothetical protein
MTNHEGHIKLWDELARTGTGEETKHKIFSMLFPDVEDIYRNACFACLDTGDDEDGEPNCDNCPINWKANPSKEYDFYVPCERPQSVYKEWATKDAPTERKRLAAIIRDLPWREE